MPRPVDELSLDALFASAGGLMTEAQAASFLRVPLRKFKSLQSESGFPESVIANDGKPAYEVSHLYAWKRAQGSLPDTSRAREEFDFSHLSRANFRVR